MSKYYTINKASKILGVSAQTLRNWDAKGKLHPHHTSSNGYRYYSQEQLNQVMNIKPKLDRLVIGYCRVSGNKQKDDLKLSDRTYTCECGNVIDRDFQASLNLKVYGKNVLNQQFVI